jgi:hypothetical protein
MAISACLRPWEFRDADVFWHLATGRWILANHVIPRSDPFSFTAADRLWVDHEWLFQVLLRGAQLAGGIILLYCMKALFYTSAVLLPAWCGARRTGMLLPAVAAAALSLFAAFPFSEYRPIMVSMVLLAIVLCAIGAAMRGSKWVLPALPLVFIGWANVHATFVIGLAGIGCFVVLPGAEADGSRTRLWLALLLVLCAFATLVNPYGWRVWGVPGSVVRSALFLHQNQEWLRPDSSPIFWAFFIELAAFVMMVPRLRKGAIRGDVLFAGLLAIAACCSRRLIPYFAIAAILPMTSGLSSAAQQVHLALVRAGRIFLVGLTIAGGAWAFLAPRVDEVQLNTRDGLPFFSGAFPLSCVERLREYRKAGHVFNDYNHGGFLHYEVGPEWKVYMDGRNDLYGEKLTMEYNQLANATGAWRQELSARHIDAALLSYDMCMQRPNLAGELALNAAWALVEFDDAGMLFVRRSLADPKWLDAHQYQHVKPMYLYEELRDEYRAHKEVPLVVSELQRKCKQGRCRIAELTLAHALIDVGRSDDALKVLDAEEQFYHRDELSRSVRTQLTSR